MVTRRGKRERGNRAKRGKAEGKLCYYGAFACLVSPGGGAFANFALPEFLTRTRFHQNVTTQRILLEKQADRPLCQGRLMTEEVCKGMFSILCMYFFIAYQARIT